MAYLLDTGVFIEAKRRFYGLDFVPGYWTWLQREAEAGTIRSIEKVADEIGAQQDELSSWAARLPKGFFLRPDTAFSAAFQRVSQWSLDSGFLSAAYTDSWECPTRSWSLKRSRAGIPSSRWRSPRRPPARSRSRSPTPAPASASSA